jgi:predicted DNA-binding protein
MRTTKVIAITMPPAMAKDAAMLAKKQNRTMSELMREAFRRYQQEEAFQPSSAALRALAEAFAAVREDARKAGLHKMTMRDINAEVAAYRRERPSSRKPVKSRRG